MAAITHAATATWTTTAGNKTNTATPALGDLIVVVAPATGVATSNVTDNNADGLGTYTKIGSSFTGFSTAGDLSIWVRNARIGSATSTVFTATQTSSTGGGLDVFRVSGMYRTGAGAVRSSGGQSSGTSSTTPAPVLSNTPLTGNPIITAVCNGTSPAGVTGPSTYTAPTNLGYATPTTGLDTAFINSGITNATITWGSTSASAFASIAIELDASVPAGPVFEQADTPIQARIPPKPRLAGPWMGWDPQPGNADTSFATGQIQWNAGGPVQNPPTSGPPLGWSSPAGVRAVYVRAGVAMATQIPLAPAVPPPAPAPFYPFTQAVRAKYLPHAPIAGTISDARNVSLPGPVNGAGFGNGLGSTGAPVRNPAQGPSFRPFTQPAQARLPQPLLRGRTSSSPGGPVRNPARGPAVYPALGPAAAKRPLLPRAAKGTVSWRPGGPVRNPQPGTAFTPAVQPVRARLPLLPLLRGRIASSPGIPVPAPAGPALFRQATSPARARITPPPRGRVTGSPGSPVRNPNVVAVYGSVPGPVRAALPVVQRGRTRVIPQGVPVRPAPAGPQFFPADRALRARLPQQPPRGRVASNPGSPVRNPQPGPAFRQAASPARIRPSLPPRGRAASNPGGPVVNPVFGTGPVFFPFRQAVRAKAATPFPYGRAAAMVALPAPPHVAPFTPRRDPARIRPQLPPRGRTAGNPGGPVRNPQPVTAGPPFRQATSPARIRPALPPRGRTAGNPGGPLPPPPPQPGVSSGQPAGIRVIYLYAGRARSTPPGVVRNPSPPTAGPVIPPRGQPARAKIPPQPPFGRAATMVALPVPSSPSQGPVFRQAAQPARIRPSLPPRGRAAGNAGGPVRNAPPPTPAPFTPAVQAVRAKIPPQPPFGRAATMVALPAPSAPSQGPAFRQATAPAQARRPLPPRGRIASSPGGPVRNPQHGTAFPAWPAPAQARFPLPPKGRVASSPGGPLRNPPPLGPAIAQRGQPVQARRPLPPRGRTGSNPGIPVPPPSPGPVFTPRRDPARIRPSLPPRGRVASSPGGPVRNPRPGPVFRQAVRPIRAPIPQNAPRGRAASNPGGPVENIPQATALYRLGSPYFQWETGTPVFAWDTGVPETSG